MTIIMIIIMTSIIHIKINKINNNLIYILTKNITKILIKILLATNPIFYSHLQSQKLCQLIHLKLELLKNKLILQQMFGFNLAQKNFYLVLDHNQTLFLNTLKLMSTVKDINMKTKVNLIQDNLTKILN